MPDLPAYVCTQCAHIQETDGDCAACAAIGTLDLGKRETIDFLHDIQGREGRRRADRTRYLGVAAGMIAVVLLWTQGWWWDLRGSAYPGLPLLADQILLMTLLAFAAIAGLGKLTRKKPRFDDVLALHDPGYQAFRG